MGEHEEQQAVLTVELDGFRFVVTGAPPSGSHPGTGYLVGPDGSRAGIRWEFADGPYIMRLEPPNDEHWGVYGVGFTRPVHGIGDVRVNLEPLMPKLRVLYARSRVH